MQNKAVLLADLHLDMLQKNKQAHNGCPSLKLLHLSHSGSMFWIAVWIFFFYPYMILIFIFFKYKCLHYLIYDR